ncbi:uncharacterized protein LOC123527611 [Mercenaria mercenaria]|uniref:uncharacterized protein LOC123527611 n=1 Tax=Mercenaria mercenaria TaxID=6596 RepID=UPI00234E6D1B|nr:uncharacterized protein LOC123527611 [Mercenaria mercenaria]
MIGFLLLNLAGLTSAIITQDNVIFNKVNDVTTTRSHWLVTFVMNFNEYEIYLRKLSYNIEMANCVADEVVKKYNASRAEYFLGTFLNMKNEIRHLNETHRKVLSSYTDLKRVTTRNKRAILPISNVFKFLFGVPSDDDLKSIRKHMGKLARNQKDIIHVLEENISILNISRREISENRQTLNELISVLGTMDLKINKLAKQLNTRINDIQDFTTVYFKLDIYIEEVKMMLTQAHIYLENFKLQLNMLSLGHLSPSLITPSNLKELLLDIKSRLPKTLILSDDPVSKLWHFYQYLTCTTVMHQSNILVLVSIPLLDLNENYEVYELHSMPFPYFVGENMTKGSKESKNGLKEMTATYELEASAMLINQGRTKYALIEQNEISKCKNQVLHFCNIKSPIFQVNLSKMCVISLFIKDETKINTYCQVMVRPSSRLPSARYIDSNIWGIALSSSLRLTVVCYETQMRKAIVTIKPPVALFRLDMNCFAYSDFMTLSPSYHDKSKYIKQMSIGQFWDIQQLRNSSIWNKLHFAVPNISKLILPKELLPVKQISMDHLIYSLKRINKNRKDSYEINWIAILLPTALMTTVLIIICYCCKNKEKLGKLSPAWLARKARGVDKNSSHQERMVATDRSVNVITVSDAESAPEPPKEEQEMQTANRNSSIIQKLYPSVDIISSNNDGKRYDTHPKV